MGKWFKEEVEKNKLSVWVFYRGIWWSPCKEELQDFNEILSQVKERGGQIYAISSQTHEAAAQASQSWDVKYDNGVY